jgi:hypothetical protein
MKARALAMPNYVASLTTLQLTLIGLQPQARDDIIFCPLIYEDGSALSFVTMCVARRGWLRETPMLVLSIVELDGSTSHLRNTCTNTVNAIRQVQANGWGWISFNGLTAQLHSAVLHPSLQRGSGVILDTTADLYPGYSLLSPRAKVVKAANNTRCYDNVTLYLAWGCVAGKRPTSIRQSSFPASAGSVSDGRSGQRGPRLAKLLVLLTSRPT